MLLVTYELRRGEVVNLQLDDIEFREKVFQVRPAGHGCIAIRAI